MKQIDRPIKSIGSSACVGDTRLKHEVRIIIELACEINVAFYGQRNLRLGGLEVSWVSHVLGGGNMREQIDECGPGPRLGRSLASAAGYCEAPAVLIGVSVWLTEPAR